MFKKIKLIINRCAEAGVQLNIKKCNFGVKQLKFFGYIVEPGGYQIEASRIEDILTIPFPKTKKAVQRYMGLCIFCSPFIPNFTQAFAHISAMTQDNFTWDKSTWNTNYEEHFETSKIKLQEACTVYFPNRDYEWVLRTDASMLAIGAVLLQMVPFTVLTPNQQEQARLQNLIRHDNTVAMPLAFISKKLSEPAQRWTVTEQELFAIVHAIKKLEYLITAKTIIIETDHINLVALSE